MTIRANVIRTSMATTPADPGRNYLDSHRCQPVYYVDALTEECRRDLENDGVPRERQKFERIAECRYHGQGFELRAAIPDGEITAENAGEIISNFHEQHRLDYGYAFDDGEVELITLRVIGKDEVAPLEVAKLKGANGSGVEGARLYERETTFDTGDRRATPRYDREALRAGHRVGGPAIIIQHDSTTMVPPAYEAEVTEYGNLRIGRAG